MAGRIFGRALVPLAGAAALGTPSTGARDRRSQGDAAAVRDDSRALEEGELEAVLTSSSLSITPPSAHEVDSAMEAIATTRPDLVGRIFPARSMQSTMESVVREIILDENLLRAALTKMARPPSSSSSKQKRSLPLSISDGGSVESTKPSAGCSKSTSGCSPSWEKMKSTNTCSICLDLLAAPLISSSCGHSFCGICVTSYLSAFDAQCIEEQQLAASLARAGLPTQRGRRRERSGLRSFSGGLLMVNRGKRADRQCVCPTCRRSLTTLTFERVLDNVIATMVEGVADLGQEQGQGQEGEQSQGGELENLVKDWRERRAAYHSRVLELKCSALKLSPDDSDDDDSTTEFGSNADDNDGSWETYVLPVIFALVALIMIVRSRQ